MIYLDHNATTLVLPEVLETIVGMSIATTRQPTGPHLVAQPGWEETEGK